MAQFEVLSVQFNNESEPHQLEVSVDNPEGMNLYTDPSHNVPSDVQVVALGNSPTEQFWVYEDSYHLTIVLGDSGGDNPLVVANTNYYEPGEDPKFVDIVVAEETATGTKTRNIRRRARKVII